MIKVPGGFAQDIYDAWHGVYWDPATITVPVLITRGDYDHVLTTAADIDWLYTHLSNASSKRYVLIDKGTHAMLFEKSVSNSIAKYGFFWKAHITDCHWPVVFAAAATKARSRSC